MWVNVFVGPARVGECIGSSADTTLWGSSSGLVQGTVVPALTVMAPGGKAKLSMGTAEGAAGAWAAGVASGRGLAAAALVAVWLAPPQAVRATAASGAITTARRARREKRRDMGFHLSGV